MSLYNAAALSNRYKEKLDSYENSTEMNNVAGCNGFHNEYLNAKDNQNKICEAVISFLSHLQKETDPIYRDSGCKYLYYWLYTHVISNQKTIENTLNMYKKLYDIYNQNHGGSDVLTNCINGMNEHTSDKLVKLTNIYNKLDNFYDGITTPIPKENCNSGISELYATYLDECKKGYDDDFCDELKIFRKKHNFIIERVLSCEGKQYLLPPVERFDTVSKTIVPFTLLSVTSFILPVLYKFTALGPWIRHQLGKNRNVWNNMNEEPDQLAYSYEIENDNSSMQDYNIAYNSS
ncbi:PIR Superfamily Protein [Plasmodium ovale curtisi]|uniref:PIR Superfamily Protein n=1 Tax=Plasmodium ovale curtisi TaxID=864141 RepID=A0A1A8XCN0_PLAOA|nr:PIR Superfamily Protein [Plasmodium ovale curtisi]SBT02967.1 PIR Superfamily Protein [Plasmodium ovale curtisi]